MMQGKVSRLVHAAAMALAAHRRFVGDRHSTEQEYDLIAGVPPELSILALNQALHQQSSGYLLPHPSTPACSASGRAQSDFPEQHKSLRSSSTTETAPILEPALCVTVPPSRATTGETRPQLTHPSCRPEGVMDAIKHHLEEITTQVLIHRSTLGKDAFRNCRIGNHVSEEHEGQSLDYVAALLSNEHLCSYLQLGPQDSVEFDHTLLTCEGLAINFLYDHGLSTDEVSFCMCATECLPNFYRTHILDSLYVFGMLVDCSKARLPSLQACSKCHIISKEACLKAKFIRATNCQAAARKKWSYSRGWQDSKAAQLVLQDHRSGKHTISGDSLILCTGASLRIPDFIVLV